MAAILQCPCCGSTDIRSDKKKAKGIGGGIGAALGAIAFGPVGLAAGAFLGSKIGSDNETFHDKKGREVQWYSCKSCEARFKICPECKRAVASKHLVQFGKLPKKAGYEVVKGTKCAFCQNVFYDPFYDKK
ncbi:MAG: hypothetical protein K2H28_05925 [Ruminococcus sp.]|nr:hypothetical protein [Ruminococcus sp.]